MWTPITYKWMRGRHHTVQQSHKSAWCNNVLVLHIWLRQTLFSWMSVILVGKLMTDRPALSSNILLLVKMSYCSHTILDAFNHLSALGFGCNLSFSYSHFQSSVISLPLSLSLRMPVFCMYMHEGCFLWGHPVTWGKKHELISPVHQITEQYSCQAKFKTVQNMRLKWSTARSL